MPQKSMYRLACLQGNHPDRTWDFVRTFPVHQLIEGTEKQSIIQQHLQELVAKAETLRVVMTDKPVVIAIKRDGNCSARSILFGLLIAASVAIKKQSPSALAMDGSLTILLEAAFELRKHYQVGWNALTNQTGAFRRSGNAIIHVINAVKQNTISTAELVYLANNDSDQLHNNLFSLALTDLSHYILYKEALLIFSDGDSLVDEQAIIQLIRAEGNQTYKGMTDLLKGNVFYSNATRTLVCSHLNIATQMLSIERDLKTNLYHEGLEHKPVSFTTVRLLDHVALLLDVDIMTQVQWELDNRPDGHAYDLQSWFTSEEIPLVPACLSREERLQENRERFVVYCNNAANEFNQPTFPTTLNQLAHYFINNIRGEAWIVESRDVLCELELVLHQWHKEIALVSRDYIFEQNKALVMHYLEVIYLGQLFTPLLLEPQNIQVQFCIGGIVHGSVPVCVDLGLVVVSPEGYQAMLVLMAGINRTIIRTHLPDYQQNVSVLVGYIQWVKQFQFMTEDDHKLIKSAMRHFFQDELDGMPVSKTLGADSTQVRNDRDMALLHFSKALDAVNLSNPEDYKRLEIKEHRNLPLQKHPPMPPPNLSAFEKSIHNTDQCKLVWETFFHENARDVSIQYFNKIKQDLLSASNHDRSRITLKLSLFAEKLEERALENRSHFYGVKLMRNTASVCLSPIPKIRHQYNAGPSAVLPVTKLPVLKPSVNAARQEVRFQLSSEQSKKRLTTLTTNVNQQTQTAINRYGKEFHDLTLSLHRTIVQAERGTNDLFNTEFFSFKRDLVSLMSTHQAYKVPILLSVQNQVSHAKMDPENRRARPVTHHFNCVEEYLTRLKKRIDLPIPIHDALQLQDLKARYLRTGQTNKHAFLNHLEREIIDHPEKTYQACFLEVKNHSTPAAQALFSDGRALTHFFWERHRLHSFIEGLIRYDPEPGDLLFEQEPSSNSCLIM